MVNNFAQVFADPQVVHRAMRIDLPTAAAPPWPGAEPGAHVRLAPGPAARLPLLGEHTTAILAELGFSDEDRERLAADGVIAVR